MDDFNPLPPRGGRLSQATGQYRSQYFNPLPPRGGRPGRDLQADRRLWISIHSLLAEGDADQSLCLSAGTSFQSTPSSRRETQLGRPRPPVQSNFNPLPPRGGRHGVTYHIEGRPDFNPLPPRGGRRGGAAVYMALPNISIHSLLAEGDKNRQSRITIERISIHSLLAEGDQSSPHPGFCLQYFNPLPPRGGRRASAGGRTRRLAFQSTPSSRRETYSAAASDLADLHFNPLPPRGGRRGFAGDGAGADEISIHSLLAEGDRLCNAKMCKGIEFQSTPSSRRETISVKDRLPEPNISIHSLLAEGDTCHCRRGWRRWLFQSTPSSRRETTPSVRHEGGIENISIHSLLAEGDPPIRHARYCCKISIHSLLAEGDDTKAAIPWDDDYFNPLPPRGGRPSSSPFWSSTRYFNPLPPRGGRPACQSACRSDRDFNPLPPRGGRREALLLGQIAAGKISIHSLLAEGDLHNTC